MAAQIEKLLKSERHHNFQQGSLEWERSRAGKVTASKLGDVLTGGSGKTRKTYMRKVVAERLLGRTISIPETWQMRQGTEREPQAAALYEIETGHEVVECGFFEHPRIEGYGASPDRLVFDGSEVGLLEIKCPAENAFMEFWDTGEIPSTYQRQMEAQAACLGLKWVDFMMFNPDFPVEMQGCVIRFRPEKEKIADAEKAVIAFLKEAQEMQERIVGLSRAAFNQGMNLPKEAA